MKKEFCTYEQSLALKELGFDEPCLAVYELSDKSIYIAYISEDGIPFNSKYYLSAPLIQQAFRFFREKYGIYGYLQSNSDALWSIQLDKNPYEYILGSGFVFNTYEEAEQACLDKLIELAKEKLK